MSDRRAARKRVTTAPVLIGLAVVGLLSGCGQSKRSTADGTGAATTVPTAASTTVVPASSPTGVSPSAAGGVPTTTTSPATADTAVTGRSLPVSVQSDALMRAAGNPGPPSSILVPSSCVVDGTNVTATGTYQGGFAPQVYARYGDVIDLYVFTSPVSGYSSGIQLAAGPFTRNAPAIAGPGSWTVTVPLDVSLGQAARCTVAAQPTHDFEGAPSAY